MRWLLTILISLSFFYFTGTAGAAVVVDVYSAFKTWSSGPGQRVKALPC